jgi:hypothetical protein
MASPLLQTSLTAGEIAPALWGQVDLRKYQTGAAVVRNFWVDYRGGLLSRPGTGMVAVSLPLPAEEPPCLLPFVFSQEQSYVLELTESVSYGKAMRIIYRGAPVCETALAIASVTPDVAGAVFVVTGAGAATWAAGQRVYIEGATGLARANGVSGVNGQTFHIDSAAGNNIVLRNLNFEIITALDWTAYGGGGTAAREVVVAHPWDGEDLFELKHAQSADVMTVTHRDYDIYLIRRLSHTSWQVVAETFGSDLSQPGSQAVAPVGNDEADPQFWYGYVVTAFNTQTGEQSTPGDAFVATVNRSLDQNEGVVNSITWTAASGANLYRIYKAQPVPNGFQGSPPYFWGLCGQTESLSFVDANLQADYSIAPPSNREPFVGGPIASGTVTTAGFGYENPEVVVSDIAGCGADVTATVTASGAVVDPLVVVDGGESYQAPMATIIEDRTLFASGTGLTFTFSDSWVNNSRGPTFWQPAGGSITIATGGTGYHVPRVSFDYVGGGTTNLVQNGLMYGTIGSGGVVTAATQLLDLVVEAPVAPTGGTTSFAVVDTPADSFDYSRAAATLTFTEAGRNRPGAVAFYQQRRTFASTYAQPSAFWLSRPGQFSNFDVSYPVQSDDAITASVVAGEVNAIVSLAAMGTGVVALTAGGAFLISGDGKQAPITPTTVNARTQTFAGAAPIQPLRVADNLVYLTAQRTAVRDLQYDFFTDIYKGNDLSVLSSHLFNGRDIVQWAWADEPHKTVQAVRDDGVLLTMTYLREQEVLGWTRSDTNGQFVSVASIPEPNENAVYVAVRRYIFGTGYRYFIERFVRRDFGQNTPLNVPSDPELAWCVDAGARFPLTYPTGTLTSFGFALAALTDPIVVTGGSGYPATPFVQVVDDGGTGSGGEVSVTVVAGAITAATLVTAGSGYSRPRVIVGGGTGAVISISFQNLAYFETSGTPFSSGDVGKVLRVGGGRGTVLRYLAGPPALIEVRMDRQVAGRLPNEPAFVLPPTRTGSWSLTTPVSAVGGLEHLEGCAVQIVADGSVLPPQEVVDGCVTLPQPATAITVGQGYSCQFQSLRPADPAIQGRRRSVASVTLRALDTRGLAIGNSFDDLVEIKQRDDENYGQPIEFQIGGGSLEQPFTGAPLGQNPIGYADNFVNVGGGWDTQGHICVLQTYPMPAQILAIVTEITPGDTPG